MVHLDTTQLSAMSRLFSSSVIQEMARKGKSPLFARLAQESSMFEVLPASNHVYDLFEEAFSLLKKKSHRHEYVYKAALTHKILLGIHTLQTASMITEFRVGECKADLVILNGTATVYEIKSERDSLSRLERQLDAYMRVFGRVYVIAGENHINSILDTAPADVGVMMLSDRHRISTLREAVDRPERTDPGAIFDSIRLNEAKQILKNMNLDIPSVPNTELYSALRSKFISLDSQSAHLGMVQVLKKTRNLMPLSDLVGKLPNSLTTAAFSAPLRKLDHARLLSAINTRLEDAIQWAD